MIDDSCVTSVPSQRGRIEADRPLTHGDTPNAILRCSVLLLNPLGRHNTYTDQDLGSDWFSVKLCRQELPLSHGSKSHLCPGIHGARCPQKLEVTVLVDDTGEEHGACIRTNVSFGRCHWDFLYYHRRREQPK